MKTIKVLLAALIVTAFSTSCSKDDDGNSTGGDLTAKWNQTKTVLKISGETYNQPYDENQAGCDKDYLEFTDAGMLIDVVYYDPAGAETCAEDSTDPVAYTKSDNTLTIAGGEYGGTYTIKKLTGSNLEIEQTSTAGGLTTVTTVYFTKAAN